MPRYIWLWHISRKNIIAILRCCLLRLRWSFHCAVMAYAKVAAEPLAPPLRADTWCALHT